MADKATNRPSNEPPADGEPMPPVAFPPIGDDDDGVDAAADDDDDGKKSVADLIAESQAQLRAEFAEREGRYLSTIDNLVSGINKPATTEPVKPAKLPDPIGRPQEFNAAIQKMVDDGVAARTSAQTNANDYATSVEGVVAQFYKDHPELKGLDEIVEGAWQAEAKRVKATGGDPQQLILRDTQMPERIAKLAATRAGELGIDLDARRTEGTQPAKTTQPARVNRTEGVSGGSRAPGGKAAKKGGEQVVGFVDMLKESQRASGYY